MFRRSLLLTFAALLLASSSGCCALDCMCCMRSRYCAWQNAHTWHCGCGCGETYVNEWFSDPPACCDPCDCCGGFTGCRHRSCDGHHGGYSGDMGPMMDDDYGPAEMPMRRRNSVGREPTPLDEPSPAANPPATLPPPAAPVRGAARHKPRTVSMTRPRKNTHTAAAVRRPAAPPARFVPDDDYADEQPQYAPQTYSRQAPRRSVRAPRYQAGGGLVPTGHDRIYDAAANGAAPRVVHDPDSGEVVPSVGMRLGDSVIVSSKLSEGEIVEDGSPVSRTATRSGNSRVR